MSQKQPGPGRAIGNESSDQDGGEPASDALAADPAAGGLDAQSSYTASHSYMEGDDVKVLRIGIDSLYLSYAGELSPALDYDLAGKKLLAQSRDSKHRALAQWEVGDHIFEVSDRGQGVKGQGGFAYVLSDNAFRIALSSSTSRSMPLAYVQVSSTYLAHQGPEAAVADLTAIIATFGEAEEYPVISRADIFADFQTNLEMEGFPRNAWITRAGSINTYSVKGEFTGYTIGQGGPISSRLYKKSFEIQQSRKLYFLDLWARTGMNWNMAVWRQEIQVERQVLQQLGIRNLEGLMREVGGIWGYATQTWLRLSVPQDGDTNRARWPNHPLWERLATIQWGTADMPLSRKFSPARIPEQARLYRMYMSLLTSFMASQGIAGFEEGQVAFIEKAKAFCESRCMEYQSISFEDYIAREIALKGRLYNTIRNRGKVEIAAENADEEDADGIDDDPASRGE